MSKDSGFEMAGQTINDVSQMSLNAERGAENLMLDVNSARAELGSGSQGFSDYDRTVWQVLEKNGTLPMLSLGHAKNNFDKLDLDQSGDLSKDELIIAREQSGSKVEANMLTLLSKSYDDIRSAHESNKYNPFSGDNKGITLDDLNAKLKEGQSNMDRASLRFEQNQRYGIMDEIAGDLLKSRGVSFSKLARGDNDGNHHEIEKSDLEKLLIKDSHTKEFGVDTLNAKERKAAEYMVNNWDSPEVELMRKDVVTYPDAMGPERWEKGGITLSRMDRIMTGGIDFDAIDGISPEASAAAGLNYVPRERTFITVERIPDEAVVEAKNVNRLSKGLPDNLPEWNVQKGQYLWMIAEQSLQDNGNQKPSVREINDMTNLIAKENNIHRNDYLKVGQKLRVPQTRNGRS